MSQRIVSVYPGSLAARHGIEPGETLVSIAKREKISLQELLAANPCLDPLHYTAGQIILLPKNEREKQASSIADERKSQVGTGDRSERIRTYNYPQGRVSDHRIGLTLYKIEQILNGDLDEVIDALITHDTAEKLRNQNS